MLTFETARLRCRPLTLSEYASFNEGHEPTWPDLSNPYGHLISGPSPLAFRSPRVAANPTFAEIGLVLAIDKVSNELIGSAGFHDFPNSEGMIEIGFGIVPERQNQGFGTELLLGMWRQIILDPVVKTLRYTVSPENAPSLHIIKKLGFHLIGEQLDEIDGRELIFELLVNDFKERYGGDERI